MRQARGVADEQSGHGLMPSLPKRIPP
jgi:hypothetical protein